MLLCLLLPLEVSINLNSNAEIENPKTERGDFNIQRELFLLILLCLFVSLPISSATNQPYNVLTTSKYVKATAKSTSSHGVWHYHTATFKNYCPQCHHHGTLSYSKYCDGGQWTCSHCDCDYDMQTGWEKISGTRLRLHYYSTNSTNIQKSNVNTVKPRPKTPLQVVQSKLHLNMLLN